YIGNDGRGYIEVRMQKLCGADPSLKQFDAQGLIERAHFDAKAASETRTYAFVQALEFRWRTVSRDNDLSSRIDQRVQCMAELLLNGFALQELHIVDHEKIDRTQLFLERNRCLRLERADEAMHEFFGGKIDDPPLRSARGMRDRLQQMRLAEPDRCMNIERIERERIAARRECDVLSGGKRELVR